MIIKMLILILFFGAFLVGPIAKAVFLGIVMHLYKKSEKDRKEHPDRYKNEKEDNYVYVE